MISKRELAAHLALGLTAKLFPGELTLADVRMVAHARTHLLPAWKDQPTRVHELLAAFLSHRPGELAEDGSLLEALRDVVVEGNDFELVGALAGAGAGWSSRYRVVPGAELDERIDRWISLLQKIRNRARLLPMAVIGSDDTFSLRADDASFRIPASHLPKDSPTRALRTTIGPACLRLDYDGIRALARCLDGPSMEGPGLYERVGVGQFLERFVGSDHHQAMAFDAGPTWLAVAPTGTGKSVFARLAALHVASQGWPVALVVPDIQTAWREVLRLQVAATKAELNLSIVALNSWRRTLDSLTAHLDDPPSEDKTGSWALGAFGYSCSLSAYAEVDASDVNPGDEPCMRLRQRVSTGGLDQRVVCPFRDQCGRFSSFESALTADILVVNHHSLLAGRVPFEIAVDGGEPRKLSVIELVLRRCGAVFIDEIDALQNSAIGVNSRGLILSSRGKLSKIHRLYTEVETRRAERRIDAAVRFERGRSALFRIMHESERLSELINRGELIWPEHGHMTWREAHDAWLVSQLFFDKEDAVEKLRKLFDRASIVDDQRSEQLRLALEPLGPGLGDGTLMVDVQASVMEALQAWSPQSRRAAEAQQVRSRIANQLILRAVLVQLDRALDHLRPQLPRLEQHDVSQATELLDELLGYAPWQPSPAGALGRRLYGYAFSERLDEQGALEVRTLSGDPHGLMVELGGLVAGALTGQTRVVVGLSATCRFRGAPRADVLGRLAGWVRDETRGVRVIGAPVEARISGVGGSAERMAAARMAAEQLWPSTLSHYLEGKLADENSRGRARALLVTGSYDEARAVAHGLRKAAGPRLIIRFVVSNSEAAKLDQDALPRAALESFGQIPAPAVLVAPLSVVARGHNILQPGTDRSAISGIFVLTRPVPPSHDADRFLAHVSYNARLFVTPWRGRPGATVEAERRLAWERLRALQRSPATFRRMAPELRRELVCDVLADLAQLAGRARRGGTPVDLVFVDGAFQDEVVPWVDLVADVLRWWREQGWLAEMVNLHGALVAGLAAYAGVELGDC